MPATLADNQMELGVDGLVVGPDTSYQWVRNGPQWLNAAPVRKSDTERQAAHGVNPGLDWLGVQVGTLQVSILGDNESDLAAKIDAWKDACSVTSDTLVQVRSLLLGQARVRFGRFRRGGDVDAALAVLGVAVTGSAQFETLDSLTYSDILHTETTDRRVSGAGFTFPITFPLSFGAPGSTGAVSVLNAGNAPAPWTATLTGPLEGISLAHAETGRYLLLTANGGIDLAVGETLTLDSRTHGVLLHGTTNFGHRVAFESRWWDLAPGVNTFTLAANSGTGTVAVQWRDAWWS